MPSSAELLFDEPRQFAFMATPAVVRALVPSEKPGVYMLLRMEVPFYVGRSDSCVRARIAGHPLLSMATHVAWETCATPQQAYRLESAWFHTLRLTAELANRIHPARPAGESANCPFCSTGDSQAWSQWVRPSPDISAAVMVAADQLAAAAKT